MPNKKGEWLSQVNKKEHGYQIKRGKWMSQMNKKIMSMNTK